MTDDQPPRRDPRASRDARRREPVQQVADALAGAPISPPRLDPRSRRQERRRDSEANYGSAAIDAQEQPSLQALRRDPRARVRRALAPSSALPSEAASGGEVIRVEDPASWCLAVPDVRDGNLSIQDRETLAAARMLADHAGGGVIAVAPPHAADFTALGVDRMVDPSCDDGFLPERHLARILSIMAAYAPKHVVLPDIAVGGGHLGRMLAVRVGAKIATNVVRLAATEAIRRTDGGAREETLSPPRVILLAPEAVSPRFKGRREARSIACASGPSADRIADLGRMALDVSKLPLADADFIVSGGVGVTDWKGFHEVARALQATIGCTRAVCDAGHLARSRQVGASGTLVDPRCYLSFGISGAPQHLQGISRCERVIAVNTDLHAEMVKRADLAIIADAQPVMARLLELIGRSS